MAMLTKTERQGVYIYGMNAAWQGVLEHWAEASSMSPGGTDYRIRHGVV